MQAVRYRIGMQNLGLESKLKSVTQVNNRHKQAGVFRGRPYKSQVNKCQTGFRIKDNLDIS